MTTVTRNRDIRDFTQRRVIRYTFYNPHSRLDRMVHDQSILAICVSIAGYDTSAEHD